MQKKEERFKLKYPVQFLYFFKKKRLEKKLFCCFQRLKKKKNQNVLDDDSNIVQIFCFKYFNLIRDQQEAMNIFTILIYIKPKQQTSENYFHKG